MEKQRINKLLGITESGEIVYVDSLHGSGVSINYFDTVSQEFIDAQNEMEHVKEHYGFLWQEAL